MVCARAPSLTSGRGPGGLRAGDMMCDGVIPLGEALRPLGLLRPSTGWWRRDPVRSRPRRIGVREGCARTGKGSRGGCECLLAELAQRVVGALEELARDRQAGAV